VRVVCDVRWMVFATPQAAVVREGADCRWCLRGASIAIAVWSLAVEGSKQSRLMMGRMNSPARMAGLWESSWRKMAG
jgi:hypothetical protein